MDRIEILRSKLVEWGASTVAFADVSGYVNEKYNDLPYAVSIAVRLSDRIIDEMEDMPTYTYFHHYRTVNSLIDHITLKAGLFIQNWGYNYIAVPASQTVKNVSEQYAGIFPHKTAAVLSGMGWVGKSGLLVTHEFGPRVRLGTILTDMVLPVDSGDKKMSCGDCILCTVSCPAMAIRGNEWHHEKGREHIVDAHACSQYMKNKFQHIGRGSVCGICVKVCPHGKKKEMNNP
ncbi:4Fe-4S double cluster binding domain-containing protein [Petroclostridium sp. X23]|uniref:4Fe-4S double cluster binding domain-containing protein n=1 Tax=Petroclostridium sp. X23 TaxID=3045146 RepID=UPI0024AD569B|nr:4Fe-4S double cluster binding domain-containing protein [Petroclostridium sp. X23]WHH60386.1 4Fe-4S double cluster binding domain-containing protein [Petroclostridium sp. X23]